MPAGMYLTPRVGSAPIDGVDFQVTKGWNGVVFIHEGLYEGGVFKFRIDFPISYPLNLPTVKFQAKQVFHPAVELESGMLDLVPFFEQPDRSHCDENYIDGVLVRCYEGFLTHLLSKIWSIFYDSHTAKKLYYSGRVEAAANPRALELSSDLFAFFRMAQQYANSTDSRSLLGVNAFDS